MNVAQPYRQGMTSSSLPSTAITLGSGVSRRDRAFSSLLLFVDVLVELSGVCVGPSQATRSSNGAGVMPHPTRPDLTARSGGGEAALLFDEGGVAMKILVLAFCVAVVVAA